MKRTLDLTPRQQRLALDLLTGAMVVSVAFALAGLTWRLAGHAGQGAITVPSGARPVPPPDLSPALGWQPFGQAAQTEQAQPTGLAFVLKGVVFAIPQSFAVAYVSENGGPARAVRVGEALGGATIDSIQRDRIILSNAGRLEYLALPDPATPPPVPGAPATAPAPGPSGNVPLSAPPPPPAQGPAALLQRLDATPTDGGYRIGSGSVPGMRAGDIVQSVNGQALGRGAADQAAFAAAQASGTAQVQILRDGKPMTLTVPLR
ncbi:signaling protein [Sphingomonas spermidinifaciens]|uniref:Signaling protein n=1 Tax=Sphingomonas spermidinifaciens TaxID=1141889 RepID=A0A2A4B6W6_9SPHN|nr:type II secretion system protein N [Sphingomonas spermidinifaciens]PCD03702.1 signaling protein [Sphingomonas spermidinifaciens]